MNSMHVWDDILTPTDREVIHRGSHKVALLDLWMKYCDVVSSQEAIRYVQALR